MDVDELNGIAGLAAEAARGLGVGPLEWRGFGQRTAVAMLLHVQIPAIALARGGLARAADPVNSVPIEREAVTVLTSGLDGATGPRAHAALLRDMVAWSGHWCGQEAIDLVRSGGPLDRLLDPAGGAR